MTDFNFGGSKANYGTLNIGNFRGVDFANSPFMVSKSRSPDALNVEPCLNGAVGCRHGYEAVLQAELPQWLMPLTN